MSNNMNMSSDGYINLDDKSLIGMTLSGDYKAFETLVLRHKDKVFSISFGMAGSREMAEDITQEVFVRVYLGLNGFKFHSNFSTWLYRITKNVTYNFLKKEHRRHYLSIEEVGNNDDNNSVKIDKDIGDYEDAKKIALTRALENLSEKYKTPLILKEFQNMRYDEISQTLGISIEQVKIRIYRARQKLKSLIGDEKL